MNWQKTEDIGQPDIALQTLKTVPLLVSSIALFLIGILGPGRKRQLFDQSSRATLRAVILRSSERAIE